VNWIEDFSLADHNHTVVMEVFSTISSTMFSELVLEIMDDEIVYLPLEDALFETLRAMSEIRPFKLVFSLGVSDYCQNHVRQKLEETLGSATQRGLLHFLDSPPVIRRA
jgi:hypothetical protein